MCTHPCACARPADGYSILSVCLAVRQHKALWASESVRRIVCAQVKCARSCGTAHDSERGTAVCACVHARVHPVGVHTGLLFAHIYSTHASEFSVCQFVVLSTLRRSAS